MYVHSPTAAMTSQASLGNSRFMQEWTTTSFTSGSIAAVALLPACVSPGGIAWASTTMQYMKSLDASPGLTLNTWMSTLLEHKRPDLACSSGYYTIPLRQQVCRWSLVSVNSKFPLVGDLKPSLAQAGWSACAMNATLRPGALLSLSVLGKAELAEVSPVPLAETLCG